MDLLKLIRSLDELLYEMMTWLLFFPRTLWRVIRHPAAIGAETEVELSENPEDDFADVVSPPLFLMLAVLLAHGLELTIPNGVVQLTAPLARKLLESDANLLLYRSVIAALFPSLMAMALLKRQGQPIDRKTLRRPFYLQCFFAAPMVLVSSIGGLICRLPHPALQAVGAAIMLLTVVWYVWVETRWFQARLGIGPGRALFVTLKICAIALLIGVLTPVLLVLPDLIAAEKAGSAT